MKDGIKHFLFVGVGFAFVAAWILTLIVNPVLGALLKAISGTSITQFYLGILFLTVVSISLIGICEVAGNLLFRRWLAPAGLELSSVLISTVFFFLLVLAFVIRQLSPVVHHFANNLFYFDHRGSEFVMMVSLPLARLAFLPALHFIVAYITLRRASITIP
jgi:Na+-transporting methylmalonyl-CoA/oxaloacetate decarboxylase gamma subunit